MLLYSRIVKFLFIYFLFLILFLFPTQTNKLYAFSNNQVKVNTNVFFDLNKNGLKDQHEWGVGGIAVNVNGTTCVSDVLGNCTFEFDKNIFFELAVDIQRKSLPENSVLTTDLFPKRENLKNDENVFIGVYYPTEKLYLSIPEKLNLKIDSFFVYEKLRVSGNLNFNILKLNNTDVSFPILDCNYDGSKPIKEGFSDFRFKISGEKNVKRWKFLIYNEKGDIVHKEIGENSLPNQIFWNGRDSLSRPVLGGSTYYYRLMGVTSEFHEIWTPVKFINVVGEKVYSISLQSSSLKFSSIIWNKLESITKIFEKNINFEIYIKGRKVEIEKVEKVLLNKLLINREKIIKEIFPATSGVLLEIFSVPEKKSFSHFQTIEIEGKNYHPLNDGSFDFFIKDVPVYKKLRIDFYTLEGSRVVLNAEMPEARILRKFSYSRIEREFSNIDKTENKFEFIYLLKGVSYPANYKLYALDGELIESNLNTSLRFVSEIGRQEFGFEIKKENEKSIPLKYIVSSFVQEKKSSEPFLMLSLPYNFKETNHPYLFIKGLTGQKNKTLFNANLTKLNDRGEFFYLFHLNHSKNKLFLEHEGENKNRSSYELEIKYKKDNFFERHKVQIEADLNFSELKASEESSSKSYSSFLPSLKFGASIFPFYEFSRKSSFFENLGVGFSFERPLYPLVVKRADLDVKETLTGPSMFSSFLVFDNSYNSFYFKSAFKMGFKHYINEFGNGLYESVNLGGRFFLGFNIGYLMVFKNFRTIPSLNVDYYYPSSGKRGLEIDLYSLSPFWKNSFLKTGFFYKKYSRENKISEIFKGVFVGYKIVF